MGMQIVGRRVSLSKPRTPRWFGMTTSRECPTSSLVTALVQPCLVRFGLRCRVAAFYLVRKYWAFFESQKLVRIAKERMVIVRESMEMDVDSDLSSDSESTYEQQARSLELTYHSCVAFEKRGLGVVLTVIQDVS
jgi:hypothetical protein